MNIEKNLVRKKYERNFFNINASKVHSMATGIMLIFIAFFCVIGFVLLYPICARVILCLFLPIVCVPLFRNLIIIILFIIMCVKFNNGNIDIYISFFDCSIVNKSAFRNNFEVVEGLKSNFTTFMALNIVFLVANIVFIVLIQKKEQKKLKMHNK